jgi:hypothetical protein
MKELEKEIRTMLDDKKVGTLEAEREAEQDNA